MPNSTPPTVYYTTVGMVKVYLKGKKMVLTKVGKTFGALLWPLYSTLREVRDESKQYVTFPFLLALLDTKS